MNIKFIEAGKNLKDKYQPALHDFHSFASVVSKSFDNILNNFHLIAGAYLFDHPNK
ncbi:hypothetical protein [Paenibacillus sp. UNC451MF]|uniref:hypothetical protein n=1 Tax=Paenibacillus sp. UNC451MF TaxID=1449063 RepID=UPI000B130534|nr:hypothetical protein [Paenibacillus sp. UNC451MF]